MRARLFPILAAAAAFLAHLSPAAARDLFSFPEAGTPITPDLLPKSIDPADHPDLILDLNALRSAFPGQLKSIEKRPGGLFLILADGTSALYDDGVPKSPEQAIEGEADIQDSLAQIYPLTPVAKSVPGWFDPGRARSEPLFFLLFGADKSAVADSAKSVDFCGRRIQFSGRHGAADQLAKVAADLEAAIKADPALRPYVSSLGGTINWRTIAGSKRLSSHSWGAAIDLNPDLGAYWKWEPKSDLATYPRTRFPQSIVSIFERHGFIWGGKWHHFDLMHFEFRPDIIEKAKLSSKP